MMNLNDKIILDVKVGNVLKKYSTDKVILLGECYQKGSGYFENVEIIINPGEGGGEIVSDIPYSGYNLELFLGDFNGDGIDEIMIRGAYKGIGGFAINAIYSYKDKKLNEIFNPDIFYKKYDFKAKYLENAMVQVYSESLNKKFTFYIGNKPKVYLDIIYDENGKVKEYESPSVSVINNSFPVKTVYNKFYYLLIRQRIIGVSNADTIGFIESFVSLLNNEVSITTIGSFEFGEKIKKSIEEEEIANSRENFRSYIDNSSEYEDVESGSKYGEDLNYRIKSTRKTGESIFIDFYGDNLKYGKEGEINKEAREIENFLGYKGDKMAKIRTCSKLNISNIPLDIVNKLPREVKFFKEDNGDKAIIREYSSKNECGVLLPYILDGSTYLSFLYKGNLGYSIKSSFRGEESCLSDLIIKAIDCNLYVFAGFRIEEDLNKLYILTLKSGKLSKAFENNEFFYSKMYLEDLKGDCNYELILWVKDVDKAYNIDIYNIKNNEIKKTEKYDKKYYDKVVDYYKGLIDSYEDERIYPYYLALAYEKKGEYKKALVVINKLMSSDNPYPSSEKLKELKQRLKKKV